MIEQGEESNEMTSFEYATHGEMELSSSIILNCWRTFIFPIGS